MSNPSRREAKSIRTPVQTSMQATRQIPQGPSDIVVDSEWDRRMRDGGCNGALLCNKRYGETSSLHRMVFTAYMIWVFSIIPM